MGLRGTIPWHVGGAGVPNCSVRQRGAFRGEMLHINNRCLSGYKEMSSGNTTEGAVPGCSMTSLHSKSVNTCKVRKV